MFCPLLLAFEMSGKIPASWRLQGPARAQLEPPRRAWGFHSLLFSSWALSPFSPSYGVYRKGFQGQRRHLEESQPSVPTEAVSVLPSQLSAGHCSVRGHQRSSFRPSQWEARRPRALPSLNGLPPASGSQRSSAQASPPAFVVKCPPHWVHGPQKREGRLCSRSARSALGPGGEGVGIQNCVSCRVKSGVSLLHT